MSRNTLVYQAIDPKAMASRRAANHYLVQIACEERYIKLLTHLDRDFVKPSTVQRHRMLANRTRNLAALANPKPARSQNRKKASV